MYFQMFFLVMTTTDTTDHGEVDKAGVELHIDLPVELRLALILVVLPDSGHTHCNSVIEGAMGL